MTRKATDTLNMGTKKSPQFFRTPGIFSSAGYFNLEVRNEPQANFSYGKCYI